ncbi:serine hydrolase domain-containing protein [Sphingomonas sp. UYAg733]
MRILPIVAGIVAATATLPASAQSIKLVDREMQKLVDGGELAGVATEVWKDGKQVGRSGIGKRDLASGAPMMPDTIVRAFSMTKPVTAVAMMILYEQGKWKPEDPVAKFLPEFADVRVFKGLDAAGKPILEAQVAPPTMAQLLTHTAGFQYDFEGGWVSDQYRAAELWRATSSSDFIARIAHLPLGYQPGTQWHYSVSMDLEGAIIERLSGMTLAEFMKRHIFDPLKMSDTGFSVPTAKLPRLAALYRWQDGKPQVEQGPFVEAPDKEPGFASGGGGLYSTADDYARFGRMLLGLGTLGGKRIIGEASARMMMSSHLSPAIAGGGFSVGMQRIRPGYEYGYNGVVVTDPAAAKVALGKGSYLWDGYASTWFWVDPEHQIVFVGMVQRASAPGVPLLQPISQAAIRDTYFPEGAAR